MGDIVIDLYTEHRPRCCVNFLKLCKVKYYNYSTIFNVQRDFVVQCGDPTDKGIPKNGSSIYERTNGEAARFFEAQRVPIIKHDKVGLVSMINNGKGKFGSQFLITTGVNCDVLDEGQVVFGEVSEGMEECLSKINEVYVDKEGRPKIDVRINHTHILDDPFEDPDNLVVPSRSPSPDAERIFGAGTRVGADELLDEDEGLTEAEQKERDAITTAEHRANVLTIVGDLPSADCEPDKNVLFVCKLNPITTDEDLELIFSRFGDIKTAEIIRDRRTNQSLQYAFIEFATDDDCERAYFKMDNVLIDDRRIHVDFSQSVAKKWRQWKFQGKYRTKEEIEDREPEKREIKQQPRDNRDRDEDRKRRRSGSRDSDRRQRKRSRDRDSHRERKRSRSRERRRSRDTDRRRSSSRDRDRRRSRERRRSRDRRR